MSSYSCTYAECESKKLSRSRGKDEQFIPFRLLVCGHSICDLCVLNVCKQQKEFIRCTVCSFNTTITEAVQRTATTNESEIRRWLDPLTVTAPEVLNFDTTNFPLDFYQIGNGVQSGVLTATKTAEMIDLDLDDDSPTVSTATPATQAVVNSLFEDDSIVKNVVSRIPRTAPERYRESIQNGVKTFTELSQNHMSIKRSSDETKDWFKKLRMNAREVFHKMHSILQIRERELMDEFSGVEENRQQELRVFMNEILSTRSELKGKLLQSPQLQNDRDRNALKKSVDKIVKDSNVLPIENPQKEFKFSFEISIEDNLKKLGKVNRQLPIVVNEIVEQMPNGITPEINNTPNGEEVQVSSDEEEEEVSEIDMIEESEEQQKIDKQVVKVLQITSPTKFYVQKLSDRERFESLNEEIRNLCSSPYHHSPAWETLKTGEFVFAYSILKKCWCRATLTLVRNEEDEQTKENLHLADIVLFDYGISETVQWYNIREMKVELFDTKKWPSFAYKCCLFGSKPNRKFGINWTKDAIDLFKRYMTDNQLVLIEMDIKDGIKLVDLIHYDVPDVTYQIPSVIQVLERNQFLTLTEHIDFSAYCRYKCQPLRFIEPETPKTLKTMSVLVSHVESPDLFYVQLQRQHQGMLNLIEELNEVYNDENAGIYTYYCPEVKTTCAALFEGDHKYYRALIIKIENNKTDVLVHFVDFGNKQKVHNGNLRLLKDSFLKLPIQALPCGLIHVDPSYGYKWNSNATEAFKYAISNDRGPQILTMCVYEAQQFDQIMPKLLVVLRSYDGDNGIKINELLVKQKLAISTGRLSKPDYDKNLMNSSQESINTVSSSSSVCTVRSKTTLPFKFNALGLLKDLMERFQTSKADKRSSLISVVVSGFDNPSQFWVQINRREVKVFFDDFEKELHNKYSVLPFSGDIRFEDQELCAFRYNSFWRRGQVIKRIEPSKQSADAPPEEPQYLVKDLDYGSEKKMRVSQMNRLSEEFLKDGAFALKCRLHSMKPTGGDQWSHSAIDEFNDFIKDRKEFFILVKGGVESEPISVKLYSKQINIENAFAPEKTVYESINQIFVEKGLASFDRSEGVVNDSDDDTEINTEATRLAKTPVPFSMYSSSESVLGSLQQRLNDTYPQTFGKFFQYIKEEYPKEQTFYGLATDLENHPKEYHLSFRYFFEGSLNQPAQMIEKNIQDVIIENGELEEFQGPYTTGAACTAYFDFDQTWNRAEIIGVTRTDDITKMCVRFVDYGNQESILVDKLSSRIFGKDIPKLALKCQLANVRAISEEAHNEIKNLIYTRVLDNKIRIFWENHPRLPMKVTIDIPEGEDYVPFIQFLERRSLLGKNYEDNEMVDDVMSMSPMVDKVFGLFPSFVVDRFYTVVMSFYVGANYAFFQATELHRPLGNDKLINFEHDQFVEMLEDMRKDAESCPLLKTYHEGTPCIAKYVDELWYRGLIVRHDEWRGEAYVFFSDHGNTDPITVDNIRELPKRFWKPRAHAFFCQIFNVKPPKEPLWSRNVGLAEKLMEKLTVASAEEKLFARFKNNKYPLKIDLYHCDEKDQTSPGKHIFQDLVDRRELEFCDFRDVYHEVIEAKTSYKSSLNVSPVVIKAERLD